MIDKTELQNAMEQYQLKAMAEIFDDDFVDKILNFYKKDPISEMYIDGIYNYYKNRYLSTGINKTHNKVLQLNICINELLTKYRLKDWLLSKKKEYLKSEKDNADKNAILGEIFTAGYFARIFVDSLTPIKTRDIDPINLYAFGRYNPELYKSKKSESACFFVVYFLLNLINANTMFNLKLAVIFD